MARLSIPTREEAPAESQPILDAISKQMGFVPAVLRLLSISPIALQGFTGLQGTLSKSLDLGTRNAVALAVSRANNCNYCMAVHSFASSTFGKVGPDEIALNLQGSSQDFKKAAAARFGRRLIETRGKVADADIDVVRTAGFTDAQIVEIVALTAQVLMTNFMNNVAETEIDIPAVPTAA